MRKTGIVALCAPSFLLLSVLAGLVSSHAGAQATPQLTFSNAHCTQGTLAQSHEVGFIGFTAGPSGLHTTVSATSFAGASPLVRTFRVTNGGLVHESGQTVLKTSGIGFEAQYRYASLTEILNFFYSSLDRLGYTAQMKTYDHYGRVYVFANGANRYEAAFTFDDMTNDIKVDFTPVAALVAAR